MSPARVVPRWSGMTTSYPLPLLHVWEHAWGACDHAGSLDDLVAECATRAANKARQLAASLGVTLGDVYEVHAEDLSEGNLPSQFTLGSREERVMRIARKSLSVSKHMTALDLAPPMQIGVRVRVAYRLK